MVMKKKNSRSNSNKPFVRFPPKKRSGYCSRWPLRQGGAHFTYSYHTPARARCENHFSSRKPSSCSEAKRGVLLVEVWGTQYDYALPEHANRRFSRAGVSHAPTHINCVLFYETLSPSPPPVIDWTAGHCSMDKPIFFLLFLSPFTNTQFDQLQGAISTCTPLLYALDDRQTFIHTKCFLLFLSDSALLVRARRSFGVLSACCHTLLSSTRA